MLAPGVAPGAAPGDQPGARSGGRSLDVLQLRLQILNRLVELGDARLQLVDRIVQRLHLAGDGIQLAAARFALRVDLLLQSVHGRGHLVGVVRGLLDQVLQHAETGVQGGLEPLHHVQQLLHLRLQLDDLLRAACAGTGAEPRTTARSAAARNRLRSVCVLAYLTCQRRNRKQWTALAAIESLAVRDAPGLHMLR